MTLKYWNNFSKKENSTLRPTSSAGVSVTDVRLKDDTSYLNPTFILTDTHAPTTMTYVEWQGRYYFIADRVKRNNSIVEISCECDVLATFKTEIGNYTAFVERSASNYDSYINDPYLTQKQSYAEYEKAVTSTSMDLTGCYVVRVIGQKCGNVEGVGTFVATKSDLYDILNYGFGDLYNSITNEAVKAIFNPFDYIVSVKWFPFTKAQIAGDGLYQTKAVYLGKYNTQISLPEPEGTGRVFTGHLTRPNAYYNDFRDISPQFTEAKILVPTVGLINIDPRHLSQGINAELCVDWLTGESSVLLSNYDSNNNYYTFASLSGNAAANVQIGQTSIAGASLVGNAASAVGNAVAGNLVGAGLSAGAAINAITQPTESILGSVGGTAFLKLVQSYYIYAFRQNSKDFPTSTYGRPLYQNVAISTLSGFVKCANASVPIDGFKAERDKINSYLNSGFYYE